MKPLIWIALVVCGPLAEAGVAYDISSLDLGMTNAKPSVVHVYAQNGVLREEGEGGHTATITSDQSLITIDETTHSYRVMDEEALRQIGTREKLRHEQNVAQRTTLPANAREMLDRIDASTQQALELARRPLDYRATDRHEVVAGFNCSLWDYYWKDSKEAEFCIATPESVPGGVEWMAALKARSEFYASATEWLGDPARLLFAAIVPEAAAPPRLGGITLMIRNFRQGAAVSESRITSVRVERLDQNLLVAPSDYSRQSAVPAPVTSLPPAR